MAYASLAELVEWLGHTDNLLGGQLRTAERTDRAERALDAASAAVDEDCGRTFTATSAGTVRYFVPAGGDILAVGDVTTVTEIKVDDDEDGTYETTLSSSTDYELNRWHDDGLGYPYEYVVRLDEPWPTPGYTGRRRLVKITGTWGWATTPPAIKQATILLAARILQRSNAALGVQGITDLGAFSIRSTDPDYLHLIQPYRRLGVL